MVTHAVLSKYQGFGRRGDHHSDWVYSAFEKQLKHFARPDPIGHALARHNPLFLIAVVFPNTRVSHYLNSIVAIVKLVVRYTSARSKHLFTRNFLLPWS